MLLPHVVKFNSQDSASRTEYENLAGAVHALIAQLESLQSLGKLPRSLRECGVERAKLKTLAEEAAKQWTAGFNPRKVSAEDFLKLYEAAF